MKLFNVTKKRMVSENVIYRRKISELILGLIPYKYKQGNLLNFIKPKRFNENDAMLFKVSGNDAIHTIFMSFPISSATPRTYLRSAEPSSSSGVGRARKMISPWSRPS